jgi:hypothetical protein
MAASIHLTCFISESHTPLEGKMSKQQAIEELEKFEKRGGFAAFKKLHRSTVAGDLRARVEKPFLINQGDKAGVCGPATIAYEIMRTRPFTYVSAATRLFEVGVGWIDRWKIAPDDDLLNAACPASVAEGDWLMLASIRDSENWLLDFHNDDDTYSPSTTLDEIEKWMTKAGFTDVVREEGTTNIFDKTEMFKASLKKYSDGYHVILRINAACIDSSIPSAPIAGNHVVVLVGECTPPPTKEGPIKIPIYTWGKEIDLPRQGGLTYGQFLQQFFGYVAAKY